MLGRVLWANPPVKRRGVSCGQICLVFGPVGGNCRVFKSCWCVERDRGEDSGGIETVVDSSAAHSSNTTQNAYAAEVNSYFGRGVTPENNVVTAVYEAFGPHRRTPISSGYFEALGIAPPPEEGDYFDRARTGIRKSLFVRWIGPWRSPGNATKRRWLPAGLMRIQCR